MKTTIKLIQFVNQRPRITKEGFNTSLDYNEASKALQQDRNQFYELLAVNLLIVPDFDRVLTNRLFNNPYLVMIEGEIMNANILFPNEYRRNANKVLAAILKPSFGFDGSLEVILSKAVLKMYFNQ